MLFKKTIIIFYCLCFLYQVSAQTVPVGAPAVEDRWRMQQLLDSSRIDYSFTVRPFISASDSLNFGTATSDATNFIYHAKNFSLRLLPVSSYIQYNGHHPYGWNDGVVIPSKGYQQKFSAGAFLQWGPLTMQLAPELLYADVGKFNSFSTHHSDSVWATYYKMILNVIDQPDQYRHNSYRRFWPGQSSIRLNYKKISLGISTENLWWGPGVRNSLIMSNNAPGFEHITFNTRSPLATKIGSFELQVIAGRLRNSDVLPADTQRRLEGVPLFQPKVNSDRYLNGMIITWQPRWMKGLHLGFSRVYYQYLNNIPRSFNGYLPIFGAFFKGGSVDENSYGRDQMLSAFFRYIFPNDHAEMYFEYGRNDHAQNIADLAMEPEHASAYLVGFKKLLKRNNQRITEIMVEATHLQSSSTTSLRESNSWYTHHQVRHGYTNYGQLIGAGIGPGSNSQTIGVNWYRTFREFGVSFERVVRNNDFYYQLFAGKHNYESHWVDLSVNSHYSLTRKNIVYRANVSLIRSLNYQWRYDNGNPLLQAEGNKNVNNVVAGISVSYLLR